MGNKLKHTIKEIELRSLAVAVLGIAILVILATYITNNFTPGTSAWNPNPTDKQIINPLPWDTPQPATDIIFSDPIQLTGNPDDPWEELYHFGGYDSREYVSDVYENSIVFTRQHPSNYYEADIFVYNIETKKMTQINQPSSVNTWPLDLRIWDDVVVYELNHNIYMNKVVEGNEPIAITQDFITEDYRISNKYPDIHDNTIVWSRDEGGGKYSLWMVDINRLGDGRKRVTQPTYNEKHPRIFDNVVVWEDYTVDGYENGYWDCRSNNPKARACSEIHMCDLKNDWNPYTYCEETSLTDDSIVSRATSPDIYGGRNGKIVFLDDINYDWSYGNPLIYNELSDIFVHDVGSGQATEIENIQAERFLVPPYPSIYDNFIIYAWLDNQMKIDIYNMGDMKQYGLNEISGFQPESITTVDIGGKELDDGKGIFNIVFGGAKTGWVENLHLIKVKAL